MDVRCEAFCFADPLFFDQQGESGDLADDFVALLPLPAIGWTADTRRPIRCPIIPVYPNC